MSEPITVVKIMGDPDRGWEVEFSAPICLPHEGYEFQPGKRWIACSDHDPFDYLKTDEIGAFMWGLKVIEKHKEMENGKRP